MVFFFLCFLGCRLQIWNVFVTVGIGIQIFSDFFFWFLIENDNEDPCETGCFTGGGGLCACPRRSKSWKNRPKNFKNGRKRKKNIGNFSYDLKWFKSHWEGHRNPFKTLKLLQKLPKIGEIGKNRIFFLEIRFFLLSKTTCLVRLGLVKLV